MKEYISFIDFIEFTDMSDEEKYKLLNRKNYEIERLNNIIEKYKKYLKEYDKWLDYNTEIGNLYWYDATPFPKLELKGDESNGR